MNYLVDPHTLVFSAKQIAGFTDMVTKYKVPQWVLYELATEVAEYWTGVWDEGQGFGSSDNTHMIKDFIDNVIGRDISIGGGVKTEFNPFLSVVDSNL